MPELDRDETPTKSNVYEIGILEQASDPHLPTIKPGLRRRLRSWFAASTFAPSWLPTNLQHPFFGYFVSLLMQAVAVLSSLYLDAMLQVFIFVGSLEVLAIALVALSWGVGPSILSTLFGALLFDYIILPPHLSWAFSKPGDIYQLLLFILIGLAISIVASQTERARRRAERFAASLAKEHARLEAIIETVPDVVAIYDKRGRMTQVNEIGRQSGIFASGMKNRSLEELVKVQAAFTLTGKIVETEDLPVNQALRGVTVESNEVRFLDSEGQERFISISAAPLRNIQGKIDGVVSITRDLSALHQSEREAASRAMELEAIFESLADGLCVVDQTGKIVRSNTAYQEIMGLHAENQEHFLTLLQEERYHILEARDERGLLLATEVSPELRILKGEVLKGSSSVDVHIRNRAGRELQLSVSGAPLYDKDGKLIAALCIFHDVTERRELEQRTHNALDALLMMAEALVAQSDEDTLEEQSRTDAAKKIALRMAGLTSRVLGRRRVSIFLVEHTTGFLLPVAIVGLSLDREANWWEYAEQHSLNIHDSAVVALMTCLQAGENVLLDTQSELSSSLGEGILQGQTALVVPMNVEGQLIGFLILGQGEIGAFSASEDLAQVGAVAQLLALVFERERLLRERSEAQATELALRTANRRMEDFVGMISHELKTPLTSIKGNTQLAVRQLKASMQTFERIIGLYEATEQQSRRLNRLVDDLLDVSRSQAGHLELIAGLCDLREIVHEAIQEQRKMWPGRRIDLSINEEVALPLSADADRIAQVIANYLTNALKYSDPDQPVHVEVRRDQQQAYLAVRDHGPGLPESELDLIWSRFHRVAGVEVRSSTHFSQSGLGLGLYISKTIIEDQQGRVGVQSAPGEGATFWFCLPLLDQDG
jgi:PAS domain S-box-containing protein